VRAQILNLLEDLRVDFQLTLLLVSHDLSVVRHMTDRVLVMQSGKIVEEGATREVFKSPRHPYTQLLLKSIPRLRPSTQASRK
jgi:peptide/nickel transport system ATP-binding protein